MNNQQSVFAYKVRKKLVKNIDFLLEHEYNEIFHLNVDKGNIVYQIYRMEKDSRKEVDL